MLTPSILCWSDQAFSHRHLPLISSPSLFPFTLTSALPSVFRRCSLNSSVDNSYHPLMQTLAKSVLWRSSTWWEIPVDTCVCSPPIWHLITCSLQAPQSCPKAYTGCINLTWWWSLLLHQWCPGHPATHKPSQLQTTIQLSPAPQLTITSAGY